MVENNKFDDIFKEIDDRIDMLISLQYSISNQIKERIPEIIKNNDPNMSYYHFEDYFIRLKSYFEKVGFDFQQKLNYFDKVCNQYKRDGRYFGKHRNDNYSNKRFNTGDSNKSTSRQECQSPDLINNVNLNEEISFEEQTNGLNDSISKLNDINHLSKIHNSTHYHNLLSSTLLNNSNTNCNENSPQNEKINNACSNFIIRENNLPDTPLSINISHSETNDEKSSNSNFSLPNNDKVNESLDVTKNIKNNNNNTKILMQDSMPSLENLDETLKMESESSLINKKYDDQIKIEEYIQTLTLPTPVTLNVDTRYHVYVTNVHSPLLFWVQLKDFGYILNKLHAEINKFYNNQKNFDKYNICNFKEGLICAAKFTYDNNWYRAKILQVYDNEKKAMVFYLDYGNNEVLDFDKIKILDDQFLRQSPLALPLTLANAYPVKPEQGDWSECDRKFFEDLVDNREAEVIIKQSCSWPLKFCCLLSKLENEKFQDALDYLIYHKVALKKSTKFIISAFEEAIIQTNHIYCFFNFMAIKFENDNESKTNNESKVYSGTVSTVSSEKSKAKPGLNNSIKDSLSVIDESSLIKFEEEKKKLILKLEQEKQNEIIFNTNDYIININDLPKNKIQLDYESKFEFEFSFIINPWDFFVVDAKKVEEYIILEEMLNELYSQNYQYLEKFSQKVNYNFVKPNNVCMARNFKDKRFYRVLIIEVSRLTQKTLVKYLDIGTSDTISFPDIFIIKKEFCKLPPSAIACKLDLIKLPSSFKNECPKQATDLFFKFINFEKKYKAKILNSNPLDLIEFDLSKKIEIIVLDQSTDSNNVKEWALNDQLVQNGFAKFIYKQDDDDFESVSVRNSKRYQKVNSIKKNESSNKTHSLCLPIEDQDYRHNRIASYVKYQSEYIEKNKDVFTEELEVLEASNQKIDQISQDKNNKLDNPVNEKETKLNQNSIDNLDKEFEDFNPMKDHYESVTNNYGINEDQYHARLLGYEIKDEMNQCQNYKKYGRCDRKDCPFIHKKLESELVPSSNLKYKLPIFTQTFVDCKKFYPNDVILIKSITLKLIGEYYKLKATIIGYFDNLKNKLVYDNSILTLHQDMNKYYKDKRFLPEKTALLSEGQIVSAKSKKYKSWLRARIIQIIKFQDINKNKFRVFYLDFGSEEVLTGNDLYPIKETFLNSPFQYCLLSLADTKLKFKANEKKLNSYFADVNKKCASLRAFVVDTDKNDDKLLNIYLFAQVKDTNQIIFVNENLINMGY